MAVSSKQKKASPSGEKVNSSVIQRLGSVMQSVASYLNTEGRQLVHLRDPSGKKLGTLQYHVVAPMGKFIYNKLPDARALRRALRKSQSRMDSVIIRVDTTKEGFVASEREVK